MQPKMNNFIIPLAIIIAGGLVAGALIFGNRGTTSNVDSGAPPIRTAPQPAGSLDDIDPITSADHIRGNPDAPVKIVEYSDFECPFCKRFHSTMQQIMTEYGKGGQVAWIYRHFPLDSIHPKNARVVAVVAECVAEQKGNCAFWEFTDAFFVVTLTNDRTDLVTALPQIYSDIGVDQAQIEACVASGKYDQHIQDDIDNAIATGGRGTPWSIIVGSNGQMFPLSGAQPYSSVKQLVDLALQAQ